MSDQRADLERRLEAITGRDRSSDSLSAEDAALREAWLALGGVLEAMQSRLDPGGEAAILQRLTGAREATSSRPAPAADVPGRVAPRRARRTILAIAAVVAAASILVAAAVGLVRILVPGAPADTNRPVAAQPPGANTVDRPTPSGQGRLARGPALSPAGGSPRGQEVVSAGAATARSDSLAWDDSIDEEIALLGESVADVQDNWYAQSGTLDELRYRLDRLQADLNDASL